jgi:hypothetical protein
MNMRISQSGLKADILVLDFAFNGTFQLDVRQYTIVLSWYQQSIVLGNFHQL